MSKEHLKNTIATKRRDIVSLRAKLVKVKEDKKRKMEAVTKSIKNVSAASSKELHRRSKISESARYDREVDSLKNKIEIVKKQIEQAKKSLVNSK